MKRRSLAGSITGLMLSLGGFGGWLVGSPEVKADVILHAFDWSYADIAEKAEAISAAGYKAVLVTPP